MKENQIFSVESTSLPDSKQALATQHNFDGNNICKAPSLVSDLKQGNDIILDNEAIVPPPSSEAQTISAEIRFQSSPTYEAHDASPGRSKSGSLESKVRDTNCLEEARSSSENTVTNSDDADLGVIPFSGALSLADAVPYSGPISYSGPIGYSGPMIYSRNMSKRSDGSSARSFAFPVLPYEWNSSPTRMPPADRRFLRRRRRSWLCCFWCCSRSSTQH
ncbi:hypothetical protein O6H91_22G043100 [Diphasiastrum complanatum]|uniref:Uncharacterized protein n=1 Tax=Diphasiastrum complanatum TaxID=34168 RepID=A0ACC2AEX1_DIPCM|nr:hypothetical protein O6H91_22G043100 [Diphasiastrum complanatum]